MHIPVVRRMASQCHVSETQSDILICCAELGTCGPYVTHWEQLHHHNVCIPYHPSDNRCQIVRPKPEL